MMCLSLIHIYTANMIIHIEQIAHKTKCRYTVARVPYRQYVEQRFQAFEKQKKEAVNERSEKKKRDEKYRRVMQSVEHAQNVITRQNPAAGRLLKKKMRAVKSMEKRFQREDEKMTKLPEIELSLIHIYADFGISSFSEERAGYSS